MENIFLKILEMSIAGAACTLIVLALRVLLRRLPKVFSYMLWAVVFLRLICPFSLHSLHFGLTLGGMDGLLETAAYEQAMVEYQVLIHKDGTLETLISHGSLAPVAEKTREEVPDLQNSRIGSRYSHQAVLRQERSWVTVGSGIWAAGAAALLAYSLVSYILLRRRLGQAVRIQADVYESDKISTPFLLGILDPRIYLPMGLGAQEKAHVLAHELVHLKRGDYLVKLATWLILSIHWFNPLVWLAYGMMARDMEMSCDESVIRQLGQESRKAYSRTLLALSGAAQGSVIRRLLPPAPLSFGEQGIRSRIRNILAYRSVRLGTGVLLVAVLAAVGVLLMTDRQEPSGGEAGKLQSAIEPPADTEQISGGAETASSDETEEVEENICQMEALQEMSRGTDMTWEQLQTLAEMKMPKLEDYAGFAGAEWQDMSMTYPLYDPELSQQYTLEVQFLREDLSLRGVYLYRESDGDILLIYREPGEGRDVYRNTEIDAFRRNIRHLGDWVSSWELPHEEQVQVGQYQAGVSLGSGVLFTWREEQMPQESQAVWEWESAGGFIRVERAEGTSDIFEFDQSGQLLDLELRWNHSMRNGSAERLEGCQEQAVLLSMNHDLYTAPELYEREQAGAPVPEEETTVDFWYVGFAREEASCGYMLFLSQRYFTKEEAVAMARSIRFADDAWEIE